MKLKIICFGYVVLASAACSAEIINVLLCIIVCQSKILKNLFIDVNILFKNMIIENNIFKYIQIGIKA